MRFHEPELLNKRTHGPGYTTLIASKNLDPPYSGWNLSSLETGDCFFLRNKSVSFFNDKSYRHSSFASNNLFF